MATSTATDPHQKCQKHIAVCAFPFGTHSGPLLHLIQRLSTSSPSTRFTFFNGAQSNAALFTTAKTKAFPNIVPCGMVWEDEPPENGMQAIGRFLRVAPALLRREMAAVVAEVGVEISCVVSDAFLWFCYEVAQEMGVPWIALWTSSSSSLSAHVYTDVLRDRFGSLQGENSKDETVDCVPGFSLVRYRELPPEILMGDLESPLSVMLHSMALVLSKAEAVVMNSMDELLPTITNDLKSKLKLLNVGPFTLTPTLQSEPVDQFGCLQWLDKQQPHSVVYISFGTVAAPPEQELVALAEALEEGNVPFIWSIKDKMKESLPSNFLERVSKDRTLGMIVPWAPQLKILAHQGTSVFVTHCGWNSVLESMVNGVPMICRPFFGDQILNRLLVEVEYEFGVGVEDGVFTKVGMIKTLHKMLSSEEGKNMREKAMVLKELAENATKQGGSSCVNFKTLVDIITHSKDTADK